MVEVISLSYYRRLMADLIAGVKIMGKIKVVKI